MTKTILTIFCLFSLSFSFSSFSNAASVGSVDQLQLPGWLERGGLIVPLSPGLALEPGDTIRTGTGARAQLKLAEGSIVKLGANARFTVDSAAPKGGLFQAAFSVVEGAFRFTTQSLFKAKKRDVRIIVGRNATIGIRGTDLWGRGRDDKDIVCLIEGKIDVTGNDAKTVRLDQPLQFFQSTRNAPPEPLSSISPEQLAIWSQETEIEASKGASAKGVWKVVISAQTTREQARATRQQLRDAGYPAELSANNTLTITHLSGKAQAEQLAEQLRLEQGLADIRITR